MKQGNRQAGISLSAYFGFAKVGDAKCAFLWRFAAVGWQDVARQGCVGRCVPGKFGGEKKRRPREGGSGDPGDDVMLIEVRSLG